MLELERVRGKPLKLLLTEAYERHGNQSEVARALGVSQPTVSQWLARLNLKEHTVIKEKSE